jgi:preprotein translocase subunit SecF
MAVLIMYFEGGSGIRPFTFCLLAGLVVGTYSSVAIAAPLVLTGGARGAQPSSELPGEEAAELPAAT